MSLLKIRRYNDPVLRVKCGEVKEITEEIRELAKDMLKTMYREKGIGLAAPQIGDKRRIIVVDVGRGSLSLVNPKIVGKSKKVLGAYEGCLSLPGISLKIKRAKEVEVEGFLLERNRKVRIKAEDLLARDFQHEIDHLDGILIIDRVSLFRKMRTVKKLKRMTRG